MSELPIEGPNAEQARYWHEESGPRWVAAQAALDGHIGAIGLSVIERVAPRRAQRVLDVGCGCGQTSLQLAERVGASGAVLGVDLSGPMLALARERAADAGLAHVEFLRADAQTHGFEPGFDLVFSRFGVMFFADPEAAFRNLRRVLKPGGRVAFVCWKPLASNPWMRVPLEVAARHVSPEALPAPPEPGAPGPFAFADPARVRGILEAVGFADVQVDALEAELPVGGGLGVEEAAVFLCAAGPAGRILAEADERAREEASAALRRELAPFLVSGAVRMPYAAWQVTATRDD